MPESQKTDVWSSDDCTLYAEDSLTYNQRINVHVDFLRFRDWFEWDDLEDLEKKIYNWHELLVGEKGYLKNLNWNRFYGDTQVNRGAKTVGFSNELTLTYLLPIVKSRVLAHLVLKHMQAFSDYLWRGFLMLRDAARFSNPGGQAVMWWA